MGNDKIEFTWTPKQYEAYLTLARPDIEELLYGGAKGGGKSVFGCEWSYTRAKQIIKQFDLQPRMYPIVVGFMGRKQSVDFSTTTLNTWKMRIDERAYDVKEHKKLIVIEDTVAIQYGGFDDRETIRKFNSAEYGFYFIDQAEECSEQDIGLLRGTLRLKINGNPLEYRGLLTANPAICWLKPAFITTPEKGNAFIQALPSDNPFLPPGYVDRLIKAFKFKPELLRAYLYGSWEDLDAASVVIPERVVRSNVLNAQYDKRVEKRITVGDISGEGDDETVIYDGYNEKILPDSVEIYSHRSLMDTVGRLQAHAHKNKSNMIAVDKVGEGAGVYSRLAEIYSGDSTMTIYGFDGRIKADDPETFKNYKTEAWWRLGQQMHDKRCDIPDDPILISQLASVTYHFTSGEVICLDSKEDLKEKLRHSPDRADACVMFYDALRLAKPIVKRDMYTKPPKEEEFNPDTV